MFVRSETVFTGWCGAGAKFVSGPAGDNLVAGRPLFGKGGYFGKHGGQGAPGQTDSSIGRFAG